METDRSKISLIPRAEQLPPTLQELEQQLEQIRQEQLAKNRSVLRTLTPEHQQQVELLTLAIMQKVLGEIKKEWKASTAEGKGTQMSETIALMWGLIESISGPLRQRPFPEKVVLPSPAER